MSSPVVYGLSGVASLGALAALLAWQGRVPDRFRGDYRLVAVAVATAATSTVALGAGVGTVDFGGRPIALPGVVDDLVAYTVFWYVTARLAEAPRRLLLTVSAIPFAQVLAFHFGATAGGVLGLAASLFVIGGQFAMAYLFLGPIWRAAQDLTVRQRLLHWKARNLMLFLISMLVVYAFLHLGGAFTAFASTVTGEYIGLLIRVGMAGFLLANVDAHAAADPASSADAGPAARGATPDAD
jgi:hypothetical protein